MQQSTMQELRARWPLVAGCGIAMSAGAAQFSYVFSFFAEALNVEFGWSLTAITAVLLIFPLSSLLYPLIGRWVDRHGGYGVTMLSIAGLAAGYILMSNITADIKTFYIGYCITLVLGLATGPLTYVRVLSQKFDAARGTALAFALSGMSLGAIVTPPVLNLAMEWGGWRAGFWLLACAALFIAGPVAHLVLRHERKQGPRVSQTPEPESPVLAGYSVAEAMRKRSFWLIPLLIFLVGIPVIGLTTQLKPLLADRGISGQTAALFASLTGASVLLGRIITGILLDRFWAPGIASIMVGLAGLGAFGFAASGDSLVLCAVAILLMGFAQGAELDLLAFLTARYFGLRAYGAIYGIFNIAFFAALPIGGLLFASIRDTTGSYDLALLIAGGLLTAAALSFPLLGRYPKFAVAT